jgi:hypothetical protein
MCVLLQSKQAQLLLAHSGPTYLHCPVEHSAQTKVAAKVVELDNQGAHPLVVWVAGQAASWWGHIVYVEIDLETGLLVWLVLLKHEQFSCRPALPGRSLAVEGLAAASELISLPETTGFVLCYILLCLLNLHTALEPGMPTLCL